MAYSGNRRMFELSEICRNTPVTMTRRNGSLASSSTSVARQFLTDDTDLSSVERKWKRWVFEESRRRLGYAVFVSQPHAFYNHYLSRSSPKVLFSSDVLIWCPDFQMLDASVMLLFGIPSCMRVDELQQSLPSHYSIWEASTPEQWKKLYLEQSQGKIFTERRPPS